MVQLSWFYKKLREHRYGLGLFIYLSAAILTGITCVLFMHAFEFVYHHRLDMARIGQWCWLTTPLLFLLAVEVIRRIAPCADGAGIPQTIFAAKHLDNTNFKALSPLVSFKTMVVKIAALLLGVWAGASTGREGPTVHVAACLFLTVALILHRLFKLPLNERSAVVAGGAAGLAAAFNTPLAGVTFAIEELSFDYFSNIKDVVLMAIIVAGLAAQSITGEYTYFGRLGILERVPILTILTVALISGACGSAFATALVKGRRWIVSLKTWQKYAMIVLLSWFVLGAAIHFGMRGIMGPGNLAAQEYLRGNTETPALSFFAHKIIATLSTYWSGIAGGIFAPSLAMGSSIGAWVASWQHVSVGVCAVLGMTAFLAGAIQAPITSFVIIYEMTGRHQLLLPVMLAALIGHMVSRLLKTQHLYQALAGFYDRLLPTSKA